MKAGHKEVSRLCIFLLRSRFWSLLYLGSVRPERVNWLLNRWRGEKTSPSLRKADRGAFAGWEAWWDCISGFSQWHVVRTLAHSPNFAPWPPCLELDLRCLPCPSQWITSSLGEALNSDGSGCGRRSERRNSSVPAGGSCSLPTGTPPPVRCLSPAGPVRGRGQAFYIMGALNIFYFLKELCLWIVCILASFWNVFNFVMFTNDLFTSYLLK